jgi:hypothetical protein
MNLSSIKQKLSSPKIIFWIYFIIAAFAGLHRASFDWFSHYPKDSIEFLNDSAINNFRIFRDSFFHLFNHQNLYGFFPEEYFDEFLYSPAFAILIIPIAVLPIYIGVTAWCVLNGLAVFFAIKLLPIDNGKKVFIYWFGILELLTSIQNVQTNPLVAALFVFIFVAFERKKVGLAALLIVLSMAIKVFGILGAALFILYPQRLKFIGYCLLWGIVVFISPILFISFSELITLYQMWFQTLLGDHALNDSDISVMRMLSKVSQINFSEATRFGIQLLAVLIFCLKYLRYKAFSSLQFRFYFLASLMIWSTIFNHAAESCSYVIAVTGIAIWYVNEEKNKLNLVLMIFVFVLTILSPTDLFPRFIRTNYILPFALKALPCFLVWIRIEYQLLFGKKLINQEI